MNENIFRTGDIVEFIPEKVQELVRPEYRSYCVGKFQVTHTTDHTIQMMSLNHNSVLDAKYCDYHCFRLAQKFEMTDEDLTSLLEDGE